MKYPVAKEQQSGFLFQNRAINDPYQWMRDQNNPELLDWVKQENEYSDAYFKKYQTLYETYLAKNKSKEVNVTYGNLTSSLHGYTLTKQVGDEYHIIEVDKEMNEIKDYSEMLKKVENTTFFSGAVLVNENNWGVFHGLIDGYDRPSLFFYDLNNETCIHKTDGIFYYALDEDGHSVIYGDAKVIPEKCITENYLSRYDFKTNSETRLFTYPENAIMIEPKQSPFGYVAQIGVDYSNYLIYIEKEGAFTPYLEKPACIKYCGSDTKGHYLLSYEKDVHGEILFYDNKDTTCIYKSNDLFINEVFVLDDQLYILAKKDVSSCAFVLQNGQLSEIKLPKECALAPIGNDDDTIFVNVESFVVKPTLCQMKNGTLTSKEDIHEDESINVEKVFYPSKDGTMIPAFIVSMKDAKKDGNLPTLMYGYGGYNMASPPSYHNFFVGLDIIDWVKDGGVYVNCCIRGGDEYGEEWHLGGAKLNKKNCYYDFIGIAEGIIKDGWTNPKKLAICGGSNGGLLMCALLTMRPDLWQCVIASVPHTDMISFINDDRGPMYITEYGDPREEEQLDYFLSYSPFHNVQHVDYPNIYIQTGECDNNVPPYHGKKMAAKLQQYSTSDNPILLRVLAKGSHDRGKGEVYYKTISEMQTFMHIALKEE